MRIVAFVPGRRPTDEDTRPGLGSSDSAALVTGSRGENRAVVLFEVDDLPAGASIEATVELDGRPLPGWHRRPLELTGDARQRLTIRPEADLAGVDLGFASAFMRRGRVEVAVVVDGKRVGWDETSLDVCDVRNLGSLYQRIIDHVVAPDVLRQAIRAKRPDPGIAYHPWYPVLRIGADKAALYTAALVADIVGKEYHLTDPAWLLRVGVYLELLTCIGIFEAVGDDLGDLLEPHERAAFEDGNAFAEIRGRINPSAWRDVWRTRRVTFPGFGTPRLGPVSALNLLRKRDATLRFLRVHHEDLKHAIELAGPNRFNAQETWQRVFRDAERAVMRQAADAFPELGFLPAPAREVVLWQPVGLGGQQGVYPTAASQYRASMNHVADWAKSRGLMDHAGEECVPAQASLVEAYMWDRGRVAMLQRQDGLSPVLTVSNPAVAAHPTTEEIEDLLREVPIFRMLSHDELRELALGARPLLLGPTQRFVIEGHAGTSLFLVGDGKVEIRIRNEDGSDRLVDTMGRGAVVGEMALLTGDVRAATVRAVDETIVYEISRQLFEPLVRAHPECLDDLTAIMEDRLARRRVVIASQDARALPLRERIRRTLFSGIET